MASKTFNRASVFQTPYGVMSYPPDAVFTSQHPGSSDVLSSTVYGIEVTGTVQHFTKGTLFEDHWGRAWRYVEFGGTVAQNLLVQAEGPDGAHDDLDIVAAAVGDESIVTSDTGSVLVNEYAQGWVYSEKAVGGMAYPISDHLVYSSAAMTFNLWHPIQTIIPADADISLVKSPFSECIVAPHSTMTGEIIGVCTGSGAGDGDFGWVQVRGPAKILGSTTAGTLVVGGMCTISTTTAGAVDGYNEDGSEDLPIIGKLMNILDSSEHQLVNVMLG